MSGFVVHFTWFGGVCGGWVLPLYGPTDGIGRDGFKHTDTGLLLPIYVLFSTACRVPSHDAQFSESFQDILVHTTQPLFLKLLLSADDLDRLLYMLSNEGN